MNYFIRKAKNEKILDAPSVCADEKFLNELKKIATQNKITAINCKNILSFKNSKLIQYLKENNIALFNLNMQALMQFSLLFKINNAQIYSYENDFLQRKRRLIRRNFKAV